MKNVLTLLCIFLMFFSGGMRSYAQEAPPQMNDTEGLLCLAHPCSTGCTCTYPSPGCYPSAPIDGTGCGLTYLSMGIAIALVVGVAAIILSSEGLHSH